MNSKQRALFPTVISLFLSVMLSVSLHGQGVIDPNIACMDNPDQSYSAYLPSNYDSAYTWPILYCFDPSGNGMVPVNLFKNAAEKQGWIVVGSNTVKNGPILPNLAAMEAMIADTSKRWSINKNQVYAVGFSGGARIAARLGMSGIARGIILCCGGFHVDPSEITDVPCMVLSVTGTDDFNRDEMRQILYRLNDMSLSHQLLTFNGGHEWMPEPFALQCLQWMEVQLNHEPLRLRYDQFLKNSLKQRIREAESLSPAARFEMLQWLEADYGRYSDTSGISEILQELEGDESVKAEEGARKERSKLRKTLVKTAKDHLKEGQTDSIMKLLSDWKKQIKLESDERQKALYQSLSNGISVIVLGSGRKNLESGQYDEAVHSLEAALALYPRHAQGYVDLALIQAIRKDKAAMIKALVKATDMDFKDPKQIILNTAFLEFLEDPEFQKLVNSMK